MGYEKRLCILKQIKRGFSADGGALSGAVHAERLGDTLTVKLQTVGLAPVREGRYALAVKVQQKIYLFDAEDNAPLQGENCPTLQKGFSALVCFYKGEAEAIAYGACGEERGGYEPLLRAVIEQENRRKKRSAPPPNPAPTAREALQESGYHDEAIAEENYFKRGENGRTGNENENASCVGGEQAQKEGGATRARENEGDDVVRPFLKEGAPVYFEQLKEQIDEAFARFPRDKRYLKTFPCSEWVEINGSLLGVIYENARPKFLCVASNEMPEEAKKRAIFVPFSPFVNSEGMDVIFYSAQTGETVQTYDT